MLKKEINLRAYFQSYDVIKKNLTMVFLDDEIEPFTKKFLMEYYSSMQNNPIDGQKFYIKFATNSLCYLDKAEQIRVPIQDILEQVVTATITIKHYNFTVKGRKIQGWNLNLCSIRPA